MKEIKKIETTGKAFVCEFHSTVPETVSGGCFYCESVVR